MVESRERQGGVGNGELLFTGYRAFVQGDENKVLELESCDGCVSL